MADEPGKDDAGPADSSTAEKRKKPARTAVLIVHGIGNQRPLDTLRGMVRAVWTTDPAVSGPKANHWLHFDRSGDVDLPVVTTSTVAGHDHQIEFHELYWAHTMAGTRLVAVLLWLFEFVRKGSRPLRRDLVRLWYVAVPFLVAVIAAVVLLVLDAALVLLGETGALAPPWDLAVPWTLTTVIVIATMRWRGLAVLVAMAAALLLAAWAFRGGGSMHEAILGRIDDRASVFAAGGVLLLFAGMAALFLTSVIGDAARYYRNSPANIRVRRAVRALGARSLAALHDEDFDRVIVVAHSLGSVIAYDVLRAHWSDVCSSFGNVAGTPGLAAQDRFPVRDGKPVGNDVPFTDAERATWRNRGRALLSQLRTDRATPEKPLWLVTDFVTLGSPLAHARYLNASGRNERELADDFAARLGDREAPTCPPRYDEEDGRLTFTPDGDDPARTQYLHHAALFALTRWTNLHFPAGTFNGDLIGGTLAGVLGSAIRDIEVPRPRRWGLSWHTWYWRWADRKPGAPAPRHIAALRDAVNLLDHPET
ncbi:MAG: hypothetical protein KIS68_05660 [Bauldia sp.]|nr:hypothetical protein [Bauldia sp.]